jgi:IS605 OrfB family transposase
VPTNNCFSIKSDIECFRQVVITPKTFGFIVEVQYEVKDEPKPKFRKDSVASIDIGLNNLCTITSDQQRPILVNGRIVKSFNQWYNKNPCKNASRKRYFRIENYFHHVSKFVVDYCVKNKIGKVVIGKNDGWKTGINLGRKNNQNFCSIPFYLLFEKIKYKAERAGLEVVFTEESYTSKASFLDRDPLPEYRKDVERHFSGKRKYRGLYVSGEGFALNADVNGSLNIKRKVIPEFQFTEIGDRSLAARPVIVNPLKAFGCCNFDREPKVVDDSNAKTSRV